MGLWHVEVYMKHREEKWLFPLLLYSAQRFMQGSAAALIRDIVPSPRAPAWVPWSGKPSALGTSQRKGWGSPMQADGWHWGAGAARACCPPDTSMEPPWPLASSGRGPPSWMELVLCCPNPAWTVWSRQRDINNLIHSLSWWEVPGLESWYLSCIYCICFPGSSRENCICKYWSIYVNIFSNKSSASLLWFSHTHQSWS